MPVSQNGYTANDITRTQVWAIPGTSRKVRLRTGAPGFLLTHLAAWFDKAVEDIEAGQLDEWGYAERPIRGGVELSNHASGTAIDLNATKHPLGDRGTFSAAQTAAIRRQLQVYGGCIRWGGDYVNRADEMHFEIVRDVAACEAAMRKLTAPTKGNDVELTDRIGPDLSDPKGGDLTVGEAGNRGGYAYMNTMPGGPLYELVQAQKAQIAKLEARLAKIEAAPKA